MTDTQPQSGWKRITYRVLVGLFVLGFIASTVVLWANVRVQDSDAWAQTVAPLADDPAIQEFVIDQTMAIIANQLNADEDAGRIRTAAVNQTLLVARSLLDDFVESEAFAEFWFETNLVAHTDLVKIAAGDESDFLSSHDNQLVLNIQPAIDWVNANLSEVLPGENSTITLEPDATEIVLYSSQQIETITNVLRLIDRLAVILPVLSLALLAGAIVVATDRLRAGRQIALSLMIGAAIMLVAIAIAKVLIANAQPEQNQQAVAALLHIVLIDLVRAFRIAAAVGLVVAAVIALMQASSRRGLSVGAFLRENREILAGVGFGLGALYLILSDNPTPWVAVISLVVIVIGLLAHAFWRRESNPEVAQLK